MREIKMKEEKTYEPPLDFSIDATDSNYDVTISVGDYSNTFEFLYDEGVEEEIEVPKQPCPYLVIIAGSACGSCRGTSCMASKDKKISDVEYCKYEWQDCLSYINAVEKGIRPTCPYFGLPPEGKTACRGVWCYAKDYGIGGVIKSVKRCTQWPHCGRYLESKSAGVPFHRKKVI